LFLLCLCGQPGSHLFIGDHPAFRFFIERGNTITFEVLVILPGAGMTFMLVEAAMDILRGLTEVVS
jgi:hypothetical protein